MAISIKTKSNKKTDTKAKVKKAKPKRGKVNRVASIDQKVDTKSELNERLNKSSRVKSAKGHFKDSYDELMRLQEFLEDPPYSEIYVRALAPGGDPDTIEKLIRDDNHFKRFSSYGNKEIAHKYAAELAGLGVIQTLLDESNKPGRDRITDIGFNGRFLTVETNSHKFTYGNKPGQPKIDKAYIAKLIARFAQREGTDGTAFTKEQPLFNGANDANYLRISANHEATAPYGSTLSVRVASPNLALDKTNFDTMAPMNRNLNVYHLLKVLVECHANIMISAETGAGKTELQKMLVGFMKPADRIISIEDVNEMHLPDLYPDLDIFAWNTITSPTGKGGISISDLVKQALRNNPKWILVAETRGAEAYEMFQSVLSDHAIITTLHAISNESVPSRFIGMSKMGFEIDEDSTERDFLRYMHIGIHLTRKEINGRIIRYIDEIAEFVPLDENPRGVNVLFKQHITSTGIREYWTGAPSADLQEKIYNERDRELSEEEWPIYKMDGHKWPKRERLYKFGGK